MKLWNTAISAIIAAGIAWLAAATIIFVGVLAYGGAHAANWVFSVLFYLIGGALLWRARITYEAYMTTPDHPAMRQLMRSDILFNLALLASGIMLTAMAGYRVFIEDLAVFG